MFKLGNLGQTGSPIRNSSGRFKFIIFNRMSDQKVFKFAFLATISTLKLGLKFPCTISVIWKRGEKLAEVLQRREIINGVATFNEQLSIDCNMIFDVNKKQFETKKVTLATNPDPVFHTHLHRQGH